MNSWPLTEEQFMMFSQMLETAKKEREELKDKKERDELKDKRKTAWLIRGPFYQIWSPLVPFFSESPST